MNTFFRLVLSVLLLASVPARPSLAQQKGLGANAALRYWSAFAQMQDTGISNEQARELSLILAGTVSYDDAKFSDLVEKNEPALETMIRGTSLPNCDWGLDYPLGPNVPVDFVRKSLVLGRLNVLYAFHLLNTNNEAGAVRALVAGLRFSHDVGNGGTLFATEVAAGLLGTHLQAISFALHAGKLSAAERSTLQRALTQLGPESLDWQTAVKRELTVIRQFAPRDAAALAQIRPLYVNVMNDPSGLAALQEAIAHAPESLQELLPIPGRVVESKKDLLERFKQVQSSLQ
ncbi:MAG: hypothetical protein WA876_15790 [Candidatus Acidiferrales bacterium]